MNLVKKEFKESIVIRPERFGTLIHDPNSGLIHIINKVGSDIISDIQKGIVKSSDKNATDFISLLTEKGLFKGEKNASIDNSFGSAEIYTGDIFKGKTFSAPIILYWEITSKCNLNCMHCYQGGGKNSLELTTAQAMDFASEIVRNKIFWVAISGGEPLMRADIIKIISYLTKNNVCVMLSTNGTLVNEEMARKLKEAGIRSIQVSIDGATPDVHDKFRRVKGSYEKAVQAVKFFKKAGIPDVTISSVATKITFREIPKIIDLAVRLNISRYRVINLMTEGNAHKNISNLIMDDNDRKELVNMVNKKAAAYNDRIKIVQEDRPVSLSSLNKPKKGKIVIGCAAGKTICKVDAEGNVAPCSYFTTNEMRAGNIKEISFDKIWKKSKLFFKFRNLDHITGKCAKCKLLPSCGGGCRAAAYTYFRDIYAEDPTCWYV